MCEVVTMFGTCCFFYISSRTKQIPLFVGRVQISLKRYECYREGRIEDLLRQVFLFLSFKKLTRVSLLTKLKYCILNKYQGNLVKRGISTLLGSCGRIAC